MNAAALALDYAAGGWPVFPCHPETKAPLTENGYKDATTNELQIRRWWSRNPKAMVGVPAGELSGVWVLDIDNRPDEGKDGYAALDALEAENGSLPETVSVRTGSGGSHRLFKCGGVEIRNRAGIAPGIDTRGDGGYFIAAGSVRSDGSKYEWDSCPDEAAEAPHWLVDMVRRRKPTVQPEQPSDKAGFHPSYVDAAVNGELRKLIGTNANRNTQLNDSAFAIGQFVSAGALSYAEAEARLRAAAEANGYVGKDGAAAAHATIKSGLDAGVANPRPAPPPLDHEPGANDNQKNGARPKCPTVSATPFVWRDPASIPKRDFLYSTHYVRRFMTATLGEGGGGKSSKKIVEALAMVTGRPILGVVPKKRLRIWLICYEDPLEETERRIAAACLYYRISEEDIGDRLLVDSGRDHDFVIVRTHGRDTSVVEPIVAGIIAEMKAREIDVLVVDPFISTHEVDENDNSGIQQVAAQWVRVAHEANASVELVHHVRKANGRELTADDGRGASALKDKARAVEVINAMTTEEALNAGIPAHERLSYFSVDPRNSKLNMSARTGFPDWFRIVSQALGNGGVGNLAEALGDHVGVVTQWAWPKAADIVGDVSAEDLHAIKTRLRTGIYRESPQANEWAGKVIAEILGIDVRDKSVRRRIQAMLKAWIATDHLYVDQRPNGARQKKNYIMVIGEDDENEPCMNDDEPDATPLTPRCSKVEQGVALKPCSTATPPPPYIGGGVV